MRIISQDGFYDVPYEAIAIRFHEDDSTIILGVPLSVISMDLVSDVPLITLGEYSTEAKAQKAMEMLREYKETKEIRSIPLTKSLIESFSNVKMENFEIYTDGTGDYLKVDIVKKVEYFKFPADEDVEV